MPSCSKLTVRPTFSHSNLKFTKMHKSETCRPASEDPIHHWRSGAQRAGMDVDSAGAVMGASAPQMRGAVLGRLKAEFSLVAMKAGCLRAFEALRGTRRDRD